MDDRERPFAALLIGAVVEWIEGLGVPEWVRAAVVHSLEGGTLGRVVLAALSEARERGRRDGEHPTPVVHVDHSGDASKMVGAADHLRAATHMIEPSSNPGSLRPTLPTEPPVSYDDPPQTGRTSRGFPRAG